MQSGVIEKLYFSIGLIDKVSGPSKGVAKSLQKIQKTARAGFMDLTKGVGVIGAVGYALIKTTNAARGFDKALNEVKALGTSRKELDKLGFSAKRASIDFGMSAAEIVRAGYDIQSSIDGLNNGELAKFTYNSAMLAKATKSDVGTITGYMSTMYGIFEKDAKRIGKAKWIDQLTGKTAKAVQMFRTTGPEIKAAFAALGAAGSSQDIGMDEQIGVLGMMQKVTGSGAVAATQYKAFLAGVGEAQGRLGLKFADSTGKMLPMADILDKIRGKFGDTIDVAESLQLKKAFGSKEAVAAVTAMIDKTGSLRKNVDALSKIKGLDLAMLMAKQQTDPMERFTAMLNVFQITMGKIFLPAVNTAMEVLSGFGMTFIWLLDVCPPLRWLFAILAGTVITLALAWGVLRVAMGIGGLFKALNMKLRMTWAWLLKNSAATHSMTAAQRINAVANMIWQKSLGKLSATAKFLRLNLIWNKTVMIASAVWTKVLAVAQWLMNTSFWGGCVAVWSFTAALLACPVTWIVIGIMALVGAVVALIYYWDDICAWVLKYSDYLLMLLGPIGWVIAAFRNWDKITAWIGNVWGAISGLFGRIRDCFTGMWDFGRSIVQGIFSWIVNKIVGFLDWMTKIPIIGGTIKTGLDALKDFAGIEVNQTAKLERPVVPTVKAQRSNDIPAGGIRNNNRNKTNNYGGVTINTSRAVGPGEMEDMWALQA